MSSGGNKTDSETLLKHHGFWRWEYQRRNPKYRKDYNNYINFIKNNPIDRVRRFLRFGDSYFPIIVDTAYYEKLRKFILKHDQLPKDYRNPRITMSKILDDIHNNNFTPKIDIGDIKFFKLLEDSFLTNLVYRPPNIEDDFKKKSVFKIEVEFDTKNLSDNTFEKINKEIRFWYHFGKVMKDPDKVIDYQKRKLVPTKTNKSRIKKQLLMDKYREALFNMIHEHYKQPGIRLKSSDTARATGLWLFDYVNKHKCEPKDAAKALVKYSEKYADSKITTDITRLKKRHKKTVECVEKADVLPMD